MTETPLLTTPAAQSGPLAAERIVEQTTRLYRGGYILSFTLVGVGLLLAIFGDGELSTELGGPVDIWNHVIDLDPNGFIGLGIGAMILTPIVMAIEVAVNFFLARDSRFAGISMAVALILVVTMGLAFI